MNIRKRALSNPHNAVVEIFALEEILRSDELKDLLIDLEKKKFTKTCVESVERKGKGNE